MTWTDDLRQDIRYAARALAGSPGFTALAIVTLALGIGANAAVFGVTKSVLLDPLPYADADRLLRIYPRQVADAERASLSAGAVADIARRQRSFETLAAFQGGTSDAVYGADEGPQIAKVAWVEPGFFRTLGVSAARGRTFRDDERTSGVVALSGGTVGADTLRVVLLTDTAWRRLFAADPAVVGQDVRVSGIARTVIGVLPPGFIGPIGEADFYAAFDLDPVRAVPNMARGASWLGLVGRLKPGITPDAAQAELAAIGADIAREFPQASGGQTLEAVPLREAMVGTTRGPLLLLMASAGLVLVITCANLAGALLSRTLARRRQFAVRAALGAGRGRLIRQLLTESTMLAAAGGAAGLLLGIVLLALLRDVALPALPAYADLSLDRGAMIVTAIVALGTGLVFGIAPALSLGGAQAQQVLREEPRGASESRRSRRLRGALVAGQLALCVSLLAGAGLLTRSLWAMTTAPLGFDPGGVLTASVQLPARDYATPEARARFLEDFTGRLSSLPGVDAAANATAVPTAVLSTVGLTIEGVSRPGDALPSVRWSSVSDDYFRALRIPLRRGRALGPQDRAGAPPTAVISEAMARRYWPGGNALGKRVRIGPNPNAPFMEIVGIVGDVRNDRARPDVEPMLYVSSRRLQAPFATFLVRASGDPLALVPAVERELSAIDPGLPLDRVMTMGTLAGAGLAPRQLPVMLIGGFGLLALLLTSVGVYAIFASVVAARQGEFGIRMALGSRPRAICALVLRQGAGWMAAGLAGGAVGIVLVTRLLRSRLFEVSPFDPIALGVAVMVLVGCAAMALFVPLRRAMHADPAVALRTQ